LEAVLPRSRMTGGKALAGRYSGVVPEEPAAVGLQEKNRNADFG
jgi:hypothetical protein